MPRGAKTRASPFAGNHGARCISFGGNVRARKSLSTIGWSEWDSMSDAPVSSTSPRLLRAALRLSDTERLHYLNVWDPRRTAHGCVQQLGRLPISDGDRLEHVERVEFRGFPIENADADAAAPHPVQRRRI